ncbi:hypothetical protein RE428_42390 [Marinobacter nanhaiticus D15-8W]|uniref:DUF3703 domain-containing protein n=1 Tax=Marinobacter nanhaiticus D15-8W TaxID=626887 RepID=N6W065_9GAMM|nr:DUF3703 domain-containing protein [Marinobacter nanhaiticus]ENO15920.1 DUF3703 domain-containing protein [Marinobacter nanhaiticus D15-8W]BES73221.1 hypothetical protein RE428_42390 [Marinobacter nanhaiticus D15-8W]
MRKALKQAYRRELSLARKAEAVADFPQAFSHLERAHILSQRFALAHAATHLRMLWLGFRTDDSREVLGQLTRAFAALLFSRIWVPPGNTGRASVSAFASMPIPQDLAEVLADA